MKVREGVLLLHQPTCLCSPNYFEAYSTNTHRHLLSCAIAHRGNGSAHAKGLGKLQIPIEVHCLKWPFGLHVCFFWLSVACLWSHAEKNVHYYLPTIITLPSSGLHPSPESLRDDGPEISVFVWAVFLTRYVGENLAEECQILQWSNNYSDLAPLYRPW